MNLAIVLLAVMFCTGVSGIAALTTSRMASAAPPPATRYDSEFRNIAATSDGCYSNINTITGFGSLFGGTKTGYVNAIVDMPIYDWDQGKGLKHLPGFEMLDILNDPSKLFTGFHGPLGGDVVGYADAFNFKTTPVPSMFWLGQYFSRGLPAELAQLASIASGTPNAYTKRFPNYGKSPLLKDSMPVNPFIAQQFAIFKGGHGPALPAFTGPIMNPQDNWISDLGSFSSNMNNMLGAGNNLLENNKDMIGDLNKGDVQSAVNNLFSSGLGGIQGAALNTLADMPPFSTASVTYNVDANNPSDLCYESLFGSVAATFGGDGGKKVPAYAFSVMKPGVTVSIPGWIYSPITLLANGRYSASGMHIAQGTVNGKDALDCYGMSAQPIVVDSKQHRLKNFNLDPFLMTEPFEMVQNIIFQGGMLITNPALWFVNNGLTLAVVAAAHALDTQSPGAGTALGRQILRMTPAVEVAWESYYSGFTFMFTVDEGGITRLPAHLSNRVVDYKNSLLAAFDFMSFFGDKGNKHNDTMNSKQFNAPLFARLKKPYQLAPGFEIAGEVNPNRRDKLDGSRVSVKIDANKTGFVRGNQTFHDPNDVYRPSSDPKTGGPTYDDNVAKNKGRSFSKASVYKIVMKPGVIPNAIDRSKAESGTREAYYGRDLGASNDACSFLKQKLTDGDADPSSQTRAKVSKVTGSNANSSNPAFADADSYQCDYAKRTDGTAVKDVEIRLRGYEPAGLGVKETAFNEYAQQNLYNFTEHIPAETPPGTKICYAVSFDLWSNDVKYQGSEWWQPRKVNTVLRDYKSPTVGAVNYNPNYNAEKDGRYLSKAQCIISGYKPSMQVRGGDLMVNGGVYTATNVKEFLASTDDPKQERTYGSWAEYGIVASGPVRKAGSGGIYRTGLVPTKKELGYLTFTNNRDSSGRYSYGNYASEIDDGFSRVNRQFTAMSGQAKVLPVAVDGSGNRQPVDIAGLESGVYRIEGSASVVDIVASRELDAKKSIIILAPQNTTVNIASDIRIPTAYQSVGDISQVVFAPATESAAYTLNINHTATQVDAWLMNPRGILNTCRTGEAQNSANNIPRSLGPCDNRLTVNGPVSIDTVLLRRNGGKDQGDEHTVAQSIPAENFNLRPDVYLWSANYVDGSGKKYITTNSIDLPPRY